MTETLTDQQILQAFAVSENTPLWKAIMQLMDKQRENAIENAASYIAQEKPLSAAGALGAASILKETMLDFQDYRTKATND